MKLTVFGIWSEYSAPEVPALLARVPAGAPMELGDELEFVDLNHLLLRNSPASILIRVDGESMMSEIADGDYVIVSRGLAPDPGDIVVARLNGGYTLKRFKKGDAQRLYLVPSNRDVTVRELQPSDDFEILGVVTKIIHNTR